MKRVLLDSHALIWWLLDHQKLGPKARHEIADPRNQIYVSAASVWEIAIKQAAGKLSGFEDLETLVDDQGFHSLSINLYHAQSAGALPKHHADPFDRMLVAQAQAEGLIFMTADGLIQPYGIRTINPRE